MTMSSLQAIKWNDGKLEILDMLPLPQVTKFVQVKNTDDGWNVIKNMQVRGAPIIALTGCLSLAAELLACPDDFSTAGQLHETIKSKLLYLVTARPTAVNMRNAADELIKYSKNVLLENLEVESHIRRIVDWCEKMLDDDIKDNMTLANYGAEHIIKNLKAGEKVTILTHCNTGSLATGGYGTALGVIRSLAAKNRLKHVYCTETRPYNQGARLTAYELVHDELPATLICDSMVGALMKEKKVNAVVLGADRAAKNGDTANKIGTYQIAVLAKHHKVAFYTCHNISTIDFSLDDGACFPIEERPHKEMTSIAGVEIAAEGIKCWNPGFDVTPADLITGGVVTEKGVFEPNQLYQLAP